MPLHLMHHVKPLPADDRLVGVLHNVPFHLTAILLLLVRQKIRRAGLLHRSTSSLFLIAEHPVNGGGSPLGFAGDALNAVGL